MKNKIYDCIIIGSGPSGYTAGIYTKRAGLDVLMITGNVPGGQLTTTTEVENFPGFINGIDGNSLMDNMKQQSERFGLEIVIDSVTSVNFDNRPFIINTINNTYETKSVIISTGSSAKYLGLESENHYLSNGGGVSTCATCDGFFYKDKNVVIVGAGDTACEEAIYLSKICNRVTLLVRSDKFKASTIMSDKVKTISNIDIKYNTEITEILGDGSVVSGVSTNNNETIDCDGVFIAIGHTPNSGVFKDYINVDEEGYIIRYDGSTKTNIEGVFSSGDVSDKRYKQAITAAGSGCSSAMDVERFLNGF